ncbi:unnamed protein product [Sphagnum balticum]
MTASVESRTSSALPNLLNTKLVIDKSLIRQIATIPLENFVKGVSKTVGKMRVDKRKQLDLVRRTLLNMFTSRFARSGELSQLGPMISTALPITRYETSEYVRDIHELCHSIENGKVSDDAKLILTLRPFEIDGVQMVVNQAHTTPVASNPCRPGDKRKSRREEDEEVSDEDVVRLAVGPIGENPKRLRFADALSSGFPGLESSSKRTDPKIAQAQGKPGGNKHFQAKSSRNSDSRIPPRGVAPSEKLILTPRVVNLNLGSTLRPLLARIVLLV